MAKLSKEEILKAVEEMTVLELSELVKSIEEKFGVSAMPQMVAGMTASSEASAKEEPKEEQTVFNVTLTSAGTNKIAVIKVIRELVPTLGLKEAKDMADQAPKNVLEAVNKQTAEEAKKKLETAGGSVELK